MNGKTTKKIEFKNEKIVLKTKKVLELERLKEISLDNLESSNRLLVGPIINWLRKKLLKSYLEQINKKHNDFNNSIFSLVKDLYNDVLGIQMELYGKKILINKTFFDENYFQGGTKSTYVDYSIHENVFKGFAKIIKKIFKPRNVIDVGCAYGYLVKYLRKINVEAYGVDISEFAVKRSNSKYIKTADITDLSRYKDNKFELVVCTEVLEHLSLDQIKKATSELKRISSKWIVFTIPTKKEERLLDISHISIYGREFWHAFFSSYSLKNDFEIEKKLNDLAFSSRTGWKDHFFVLRVDG